MNIQKVIRMEPQSTCYMRLQYMVPGGSRPVTETAYTPGLKLPAEGRKHIIIVQ